MQITAGPPACEDPRRKSSRPPLSERCLGLLAAAVMAGCSVLHLVAAAQGAHGPGWHVLLLLGMALVCLPCAAHAVLAPGRPPSRTPPSRTAAPGSASGPARPARPGRRP